MGNRDTQSKDFLRSHGSGIFKTSPKKVNKLDDLFALDTVEDSTPAEKEPGRSASFNMTEPARPVSPTSSWRLSLTRSQNETEGLVCRSSSTGLRERSSSKEHVADGLGRIRSALRTGETSIPIGTEKSKAQASIVLQRVRTG